MKSSVSVTVGMVLHLVYFGNCKEYIVQLRLLRPIMEKTFAGLQVYLACKDEYMYLLNNESKTLSASSLKTQKQKFAYIREIYTEINKHPVEELMLESEINFQPICNNIIHPELIKGSCLLLTTANLPTRSLNANQITHALDYIKKQGCQAHFNKKIDDFDWAYIVSMYKKYLKTVKTKKDLKNCKLLCSLFYEKTNTTDYSKNPEIVNVMKKEVPIVISFLE
jgi:hypothetical protein